MPGQKYENSGKPYLRIVGGSIVQTVEKNTKGARLREYELKDGTRGSKWELVYANWTGKIIGIVFKESDFGESCVIELNDAFFTLNIDSRYFQDFACKVFSADLTKPITFHPYDMEVDIEAVEKRKRGISMKQNGEKLQNYFYDYKEKKALHGFPAVDQEKAVKSTYWKVYFIQAAEFLVEKLKELNFAKTPAPSSSDAPPDKSMPWEQI